MATALTERGVTRHEVAGADDPFHDPLMIGVGIVFFLVALFILALTGLLYWGVEHHLPAWSTHSFPPPVVH